MNQQLFNDISEWQDQTFGTATAQSKLHHLKEEIEELLTDLEHKKPTRHLEYADCFLLLFGSAASDGMSYEDIENCIREKFEIIKKRKWGKPDENGVVKHLKQ